MFETEGIFDEEKALQVLIKLLEEQEGLVIKVVGTVDKTA